MERNLAGVMSLAAALCLTAAGTGRAEGPGGNVASMGLGVGIPLSGLDLSRFGGGSEAPGGAGVAVSPQFLHYVDPHVGLGGELSYLPFSDREVTRPGLSDLTVGGSLLDVEGVAQYLFYPDARVSPYVTGGLGIASFAAHVQRLDGDTLLDSSSAGLALSAGAGVQAAVTDTLLLMGDLRWHFASTSSSSFGTGTANALALLFRLGWKL